MKARAPSRHGRTGPRLAVLELDGLTAPRPRRVPATIAIVCTANQCRSPVAEMLFRVEAEERGLELTVFSMGFLGGGHPVPERGVEVAAEFGLDLSEHLSEQVDQERLATADLILGMTREHARGVVSGMPQTWPRVFTLKQFSRFTVGLQVPRRANFASWLESEASERSRQELMGTQPHDDVADPMGHSKHTWRQVIREIRFHVTRVLDDCEPVLLPTTGRLAGDPTGIGSHSVGLRRGSRGRKLPGWPSERRRRSAV